MRVFQRRHWTALFKILSSAFVSTVLVGAAAAQPVAVDDFINSDVANIEPIDGGFLVSRIYNEFSFPVVAVLLDAGFVIVWQDYSEAPPDEWGLAIRAQRYGADGTPDGTKFLVNTTTERDQRRPSVAALSGGGFVIAWEDDSRTDGDTSGLAIRAQRYGADGTPDGTEFLVNTRTVRDQRRPSVAALSGGGFVIAWEDDSRTDGDTSGLAIRAQRYGADGTPDGSEFLVNTTTERGQRRPSVAALSEGGFIIAWEDDSQSGDDAFGLATRAQRYGADGAATGAEFLVNTTTERDQRRPSVAALSGGGFVIAWEDDSRIVGDTSELAIRAQQYGADGAATGAEFLVNTTPQGSLPSVSALAGRGFVVSWQAPSWALRAQRYDNDGAAAGGELLATISPQDPRGRAHPSVAGLLGGGFVISWDDFSDGFGSSSGTSARLFVPPDLFANLAYNFEVLANDFSPSGDPLILTHINGQVATVGGAVLLPSGASVTLLENGHLSYDPRSAPFAIALPAGVTGEDSFTYTISDGSGSDSATVTVVLTGVNEPPVVESVSLGFFEKDAARDVTAELLSAASDPDAGETGQLVVSAIDTSGTLGQAALSGGAVTYQPGPAFLSLAQGQTAQDSFTFTVRDPHDATATATATVTITGENDPPVAESVSFTVGERDGPLDITGLILAGASDPDANDVIAITAIDDTQTLGLVTLANGVVTYEPGPAFFTLAAGETGTDSLSFTVSDLLGATDTAVATVSVTGFAGWPLTVSVSGLGGGTVSSFPAGVNCSGSGGACTALFKDIDVELFASPLSGARFDGWGGQCPTADGASCILSMNGARAATARFILDNPPEGRIVAATLPGARSGYVGGPDITVFASVISRQATPAQSCAITAPDGAPVALTYRRVNASNEAIGEADPLFDIPNGGLASFVLGLTPQAATGEGGYVFFPLVTCENALLDPIEGVNSVLLSIGDAPSPDVLSIAATPSGDGVIRIATVGGINFMSAAAVNIGAGDGSGAPGEATITVFTDTGSASLPLTIQVCETGPAGGCLAPRSDDVTTVFEQNEAKFFAVFVRVANDAGVAFSPANARVFLRFRDADGVIRSATSAAVTAPAPEAGSGEALTASSGLPDGRWSVLVRTDQADWPRLVRGDLFVLADGAAILATRDGARLIRLSPSRAQDAGETRFTGVMAGSGLALEGGWSEPGAIHMSYTDGALTGSAWGVRDARGAGRPGAERFEALAGVHEHRELGHIDILLNGAVRGVLSGCEVRGAPDRANPAAPGLVSASLTLSGCAAAGAYRAVLDMPANENEAPALVIAGERGHWRVELGR
ncbi:Ig-like domain-containing protein [Hyphomonadaceae bacterium ML37]|nr:Ig-like domain-containing protein [Hyphomonadaceae bacterium ML37]